MNTTFKRVVHSVSSFAVAASLVMPGVPTAVASSCGFTDIPNGNEFDVYVCSLYNAGVVSGVTPTTFEPMRNMTRGEVAKVIVRGKGLQINTVGGPHFTDVTTSSAFYSYVETLYNAGVVSGYGNGLYGVNNSVTRGEFSKMVSKAWMIPVDLTGAPHFSDVPSSNGFYQFIETLKNNNIISGYANGTFGPNNNVLRQEVAKMIDRTMKLASTTGFTPGTGARLDVQSNATQVVANCYSTAGITVTAYDKFGAVDESFTDNVTVEATLGNFSGSSSTSETKKAQTGRASFTLTSCTAGSSNVSAKATSFSPTTVEVRFTTSAQGPNDAKGPSCVTGTGCLELSAISDKLLPATNANTPPADELDPVIGGEALVQAYLYDSNGDPMSVGSTAIRCSLTQGTGALVAPVNFDGAPQAAEVRAAYLTEEVAGNGRYIANYEIVDGQIPGNAVIECTDITTSPALTNKVTVELKPIVVKTWVADSTILASQVGTPGTEPTYPGIQASTVLFATTLDQYGDPRTLDCDNTGAVQPEVRATAGPSDLLVDGSTISTTAAVLTAVADADANHTYLQGLYAANLESGDTPGTTTVEVRLNQCIGQPRATTSVTVQEPKMDLFASSTTIGGSDDVGTPGDETLSYVFVRVTDQNGKPLDGETLRANQQSGPYLINTNWDTAGGTIEDLAAAGAPGFYVFEVDVDDANFNSTTAQPIVIRVTDESRKGTNNAPMQATITIQVNNANRESENPRSLTLVPLRTTVGANDGDSALTEQTPVVAFYRDTRGNGVVNQFAICADSTPYTVVGTTFAIDTVAVGAVNFENDGVCIYSVDFENIVGNTRVQVRFEDATGSIGILNPQEVSFDVRDRSIELEPINTKLTVGDGSGTIAYVRDEVGDGVDDAIDGGSVLGDFEVVFSDSRIDNGGTPAGTTTVNEFNFVPSGVYWFNYHIPRTVAITNLTVRATIRPDSAVTNPTDSFTITASPVSVKVNAHPTATIADNCVLFDAIVRNGSGAPMTNINTLDNFMEWEIVSSTGTNGSIAGDNTGCAAFNDRALTNAGGDAIVDNGTVNNDGVYVITYNGGPISSVDTVRAYLKSIANTPEGQATVTVR